MKRFLMAAVAVAAVGVAAPAMADTDVSARGGIQGFTSGGPVGPSAGVQVDTMVNKPLGVEIGYDGARIPTSTMGGSATWSHGLDAQLRLTPTPTAPIRPFVAGGLGVGYFEAQNGNTGDGQFSGALPLSAGVSFGDIHSLNVGVRGTYKYEFNRDLGVSGSPGGNLLGADLTLGGRF